MCTVMRLDERMEPEARLTVTELAIEKLLESIEMDESCDIKTTYIRVGSKSGGCSGHTFTIETDDVKLQEDDEYDFGSSLRVIVNRWDLQNLIGTVQIDYRDDNLVQQGFVFHRAVTGGICGCGESFTPLNKMVMGKEKLGW